jgi:hypothetical protein
MSRRDIKTVQTERYTLKRVREFDDAEKVLANYFAREVPYPKPANRSKNVKRKPGC